MDECVHVSLPGGESFSARRDENLLAAAQRAHWLIRFGCRNGNCEACAATLLIGRVEQRGVLIAGDGNPQPLLLCLACAQTDLLIQLPSDPLHGSAEHARRVYAQLQRVECAADGRWRVTLMLPAGRPLPLYAGQYVRIESEPLVDGFIEGVGVEGIQGIEGSAARAREITAFVDSAQTLKPGARIFVHYPLGYAYRIADSARALWLLCEAATISRARHLQALWPGSELIDRDTIQTWPKTVAPPIIHAYAITAATVLDWYRTLLAERIPFVELRSDFSVLRPWRVCRQDDNANRFVMAEFLDEPAARALVEEFTARGHKQRYWAEPVGDEFENRAND